MRPIVPAAVLVLFGLALASCKTAPETPAEPVRQKVAESSLEEGLMYVQLTEELAEKAERGQTLDFPGFISMERLYPDAGEWEPRHRAEGLHLWYKVSFDTSLPVTKAESDVSDIPGVVYTEPVRRKRIEGYFNDPESDRQWALFNDGSGKSYTEGCDINVVPVWERFCTGNSNVIVAVLDQGVMINHPDLEAVTMPGGPNGSRCFITGDTGYNIEPGDHGTHVAGIIAAINNNGVGISGIAGGDGSANGVRIISCECLRPAPDPDDPSKTITLGGDETAAFVWAADRGAVIANCSWGYVFDNENQASHGSAGSAKAGIDYFIKYAGCDNNGNQLPGSPMKGGLVVFAAGNESWQHAWPAEYSAVMAVGSISASRSRAYYSNYGDWVDICAPGGDAKLGPTILSCVADGGYRTMQGTSMAAPHVSGVAALITSYYGGPGFTNEMLWQKLIEGANPAGAPAYGRIGPLVDVLGSFSLGGTIAPDPLQAFDSGEVRSNFVTLNWKVTADEDDVKAYSYLVYASKDRTALENIDPKNLPSSVIAREAKVHRVPAGQTMSYTFSGLAFTTDYYFTAIAKDYAGNLSAQSEIMQVKTGENHAPVIRTDHEGELKVKSHETLSARYTIEDPDGHGFTYQLETGSDAMTAETQPDNAVISIKGLLASPGKYTGKIIAKDEYGMEAVYEIHYEILPNHAPVIKTPVENLILGVGEKSSLDISEVFYDEDDEPLTYNVSFSVQSIAHLSPNGNIYLITGIKTGLTEVTLTAADARKEECKAVFKILIPDKSYPVVLYPNPVSSQLNIRPSAPGSFEVTVSNKAGAVVFSTKQDIDPFEPMAIDMSDKSAGTYSVHVSGNGIDENYTIAKI